MRVFVGVCSIYTVVGAHNRLWLSLAYRISKSFQIDFAQGPFIHDLVHDHSPCLLAVNGKVFRAGGDALRLDAADHRRRKLARKQRILRKILKVPPAERVPLDVQPWPQQDAHVLRCGFLSQAFADTLQQRLIPAVRKSRCGRKARRRQALVQAEMVRLAALFAQPVRAVRQHDGGNTKPANRLGIPEILSREQGCFFFQRHLLNQALILPILHGYLLK
ncbi:hypothetical protein SDC9_128881 [bioreactor metagenome]|uniref:Uncharacterized protein n=1 Tax=bioreactor metagenome TaxID=1076179 RepID=A0A645CXZ6_9ZZZZ